MQEKYGNRGFRVLAVNAWDEPEKTVHAFIRQYELPYTVALDGSRVFRGPYKGRTVPFNYLLDRQGKIVDAHRGWDPARLPLLEAKIQKALE